jgi:hypothetical protein
VAVAARRARHVHVNNAGKIEALSALFGHPPPGASYCHCALPGACFSAAVNGGTCPLGLFTRARFRPLGTFASFPVFIREDEKTQEQQTAGRWTMQCFDPLTSFHIHVRPCQIRTGCGCCPSAHLALSTPCTAFCCRLPALYSVLCSVSPEMVLKCRM